LTRAPVSQRLLVVATDALGWRSQSAILAGHLAETYPGLQVRTISYQPPKPVRPLLKDVYARFRRRRLGLISSMTWARFAFSHRLARGIRHFRPDAVLFIGHFAAAALPAGPRAYRTGMVCDISVPVAQRLFRPTQLTDRDVRDERRIAKGMDIILPNSEGVAESFRSDHGIDARKVRVCRPFCRLPQDVPPRGEQPARLTVGFVGHDLIRKGGDLLLQAFDAGLNQDVDLVLAGDATKLAAPRPGVTILGAVPNQRLVAEVMPGFDIFCLPTREDMNPLVLAEAGNLGIPCVVTDVGFIREIVLHERTGLLVPIDDAAALAAAIRRLAADRPALAAMGRAATAHIRRNFALADNVAGVLDALLPAGAPWGLEAAAPRRRRSAAGAR
jgi:glycosyltransferase involved in cell wall biosynthesis